MVIVIQSEPKTVSEKPNMVLINPYLLRGSVVISDIFFFGHASFKWTRFSRHLVYAYTNNASIVCMRTSVSPAIVRNYIEARGQRTILTFWLPWKPNVTINLETKMVETGTENVSTAELHSHRLLLAVEHDSMKWAGIRNYSPLSVTYRYCRNDTSSYERVRWYRVNRNWRE